MKIYSLFFIYLLESKVKVSKISNMLKENKTKILEILKGEKNDFICKNKCEDDDQISSFEDEKFSFFVLAKRFSQMNSFLKTIEINRSMYNEIKFLYRWVYDEYDCYSKNKPLYSNQFSNFILFSSRHIEANDQIVKLWASRGSPITEFIRHSDNFPEFEKTIYKEKVKIMLSDLIGFTQQGEQYKKIVKDIFLTESEKTQILELDSSYLKAPRLFAFLEATLPLNEISGVSDTFQKYFEKKHSYEVHLLQFLNQINDQNENDEEQSRAIFDYFFEENLDFKNINSKKILELDFYGLSKLIDLVKDIDFGKIFNKKEDKFEINMMNNILSAANNFDYIVGLEVFNEDTWDDFRLYYEYNMNICNVFLLLRDKNVEKFINIFKDDDKEQMSNDEFFYYKINKIYYRGIFIYENIYCDMLDFLDFLDKRTKKHAESDYLMESTGKSSLENRLKNQKSEVLKNYIKERRCYYLNSDSKHPKDFINYIYFEKTEESSDSSKIYDKNSKNKIEEILISLDLIHTVCDNEYNYKILYEKKGRALYCLEVVFSKCLEFEFKMNALLKIFKQQLQFFEENSSKLNYKTGYLIDTDYDKKREDVGSYFNFKNVEALCSHKDIDKIFLNLDTNIGKFKMQFPLKDLFLIHYEAGGKIRMRPSGPESGFGSYFSFPFILNDEHIIKRTEDESLRSWMYILQSGFIFKYVSEETNIESLCYIKLTSKTLISIKKILGLIQNFLQRNTKQFFLKELINLYKYEYKCIEQVLDFFLIRMAHELESPKKYINLINDISKIPMHFYDMIDFLLSNMFDQIMKYGYNDTIEKIDPPISIFQDIKNIVHGYLKENFDRWAWLRKKSKKELGIHLHVLDERENVRNTILNEFKSKSAVQLWKMLYSRRENNIIYLDEKNN